MAKAAGFNGIQALPMKFWDYTKVDSWKAGVISYEDAFMYGPLWKALFRQFGIVREPAPTLIDWVLFGQEASWPFQNAIAVQHSFQPGSVVEIHPELGTHIDDYIAFCASGGKVCLDTYHLRRSTRIHSSAIDWKKLLNLLPPKGVSLIHVHPIKSEISGFLGGVSSELTSMLQYLAQRFPDVPAIVEVFPTFRAPSSTILYMSRLLYATKKWLS
jgi:hypothetical protein